MGLWSLVTLLLLSVIFAPISWWPVSFVALVPWLVMVGRASRAPRVYFYSYVLGLAFFLINMRWLYHATGLGYLALSVYQAAYFPLVAYPVRSVVRRRHWRLAVVFPFVWVGSEMLRAVFISGFPWFFLAHSLYTVKSLIQISDLVGAYGVSFVVAAVNGALADVMLARMAAPGATLSSVVRSKVRWSVAFALVLVAASEGYGQFQLHRNTMSVGPKIAVLQGDFVNTVYGVDVSNEEKRKIYMEMLGAASAEHPDLYLLPESPWSMYLNPQARNFNRLSRESFDLLQSRASRHHAYIVTGSGSLVPSRFDLLVPQRYYNSATVFHPDGREPDRYDKIHLVYFGETVPFRFGRLRFLYFWLNRLMPFSGPDGDREYSLFPGEEFKVFSMEPASQPGQMFHFGIPICYEDVMPYVSREFVWGGHNRKRADFLLNISNDGWFGRGIQQPQHLAICVFRAVENRVGIARAVNTGVSGFIDPDGRFHDLLTGKAPPGRLWSGRASYAVAHIMMDSRATWYSRYGDWFGWTCAAVWLALLIDYWIVRARTRHEKTLSPSQKRVVSESGR